MLIILGLATAWGGWRITRAALASLRSLPRSNEDWIYY